jgi:hypothetical protein
MPGASEQTCQVNTLNANWVAGEGGEDGSFKLMMITDDDRDGRPSCLSGADAASDAAGLGATKCY